MSRTKIFLWFIVPILFLFHFSAFASTSCSTVFDEKDINSLCEKFISDVQGGSEISLVLQNAEKFVLQRVKPGDRTNLKSAEDCYKAEGIQINLFYEDDTGVKVDRLLTIGKTSSSTVSVKSCQRKTAEGERSYFAEVSVHIFWSQAEPDSIRISADRRRLSPGESTTLKVQLKCGDCPLSGKRIILRAENSGEIFPSEVTTGANGEAVSRFTMKKQEPVRIFALYRELKDVLEINPRKALWNLEVNVTYRGKRCRKEWLGTNFKNWRPVSEAEYNYHAKFTGLNLNELIEKARNYPAGLFPSSFKMFPLSDTVSTPSKVRGYIRIYSCPKFPGKKCYWSRTNFDSSSTSILTLGIPGKKNNHYEYLIMSLKMGSVINKRTRHVYDLDPPFPYIKSESEPDMFPYVLPVKLPFEKIRALEPFQIEYTFSTGNDCKKQEAARTWKFVFKFYPAE